MAQKLRDDKIGALSHSSGVITLTSTPASPSWLTIGGQQYKITSNRTLAVSGTVANTLYMIYAVQTAGVVSLVQSTNVNSVGPAGYASWKLVGAFYAGNAGFGSLVGINDIPRSGTFSYTLTATWTAGFTYDATIERDGKYAIIRTKLILNNAPTPNVSLLLNTPPSLTIADQFFTGTDDLIIGEGTIRAGQGFHLAMMYVSSTSVVPQTVNVDTTSASAVDPSKVNTFTANNIFGFANGHTINTEYKVPIVGWSDTPLKDL